MPKASSGGVFGADFLISNGTNFPFSNVLNTSSGGVLGADFQHEIGTNSLISNGTIFPISNLPNASSGGVLGADSLISNGTNFPISNLPNASPGGVSGSDWQRSLLAVTYTLVLLLGLAGGGLSLSLSLSLLSRRARPLSHSYVLLLHLALLDALFLALLPLHIHSQLLGDAWSFGAAACGVSRAVFCLHTSLSVAFLGCLAGDAWLAALRPFASLRLRARHYLLLATALWALALGAAVPLVLHSSGLRSCFGVSFARPAAPEAALWVVFGAFVPFLVTVVGFPLAAGSVWRSGQGRARRRALGTVSIALAICALCFLPQQLSQLLQFLLEVRGSPREPLPGLTPQMRRVTEVLASLSCCLNPVLYRFQCSSTAWHCPCGPRAWHCPCGPRAWHCPCGPRAWHCPCGPRAWHCPCGLRAWHCPCGPRAWHCPCGLRARPKRVFTICDNNFGDPSWDYGPGQRSGKENPRGWSQLIHSRWKSLIRKIR